MQPSSYDDFRGGHLLFKEFVSKRKYVSYPGREWLVCPHYFFTLGWAANPKTDHAKGHENKSPV
jgi:hypothetical protein